MGVRLLPLLLAAAYGLPDIGQIPPPDAARQARIEKALAVLRTGEGKGIDAAVRDLALCGEAALPAIVKRLNEAGAGERLLLLAAASPMASAAALLEQARADPHPAVRAWAQGPPRGREPALRDLAQRYLDLLAVAERRLYADADDDLKRLEDRLGQPADTLETLRRRMEDKDVQNAVRLERERAAIRFASKGALALARGEMTPDLTDAVFVAFTGLLREEGTASYYAAVALVAKGEAASPALEELLDRENHDEKKIARLLCAIRADRGRGLYPSFDRRPPVQRALLDLAPDILEGAELVSLLERAALGDDESVRTTALDALLELPAPAGREPARALVDPQRFGAAEFKRATELLARCGDLEPLALYAAIPPVPAGPTGNTPQLSSLRSAVQTALRGARGHAVEEMGRRFLDAEAKELRTLGIDLVRDKAVLLAHARAEPAHELARATVLRLLALHPEAAEDALGLLAARGLPADTPVLQLLVACGRIDLVVGLSASGDAALSALGNLETIDARFEAPLLALHDAATKERKRVTLAALAPLGTEEVRRRFEAAPDLALGVLRQRADGGFKSPFPFPLRRFLDGADGLRLRLLADVAEVVPSLEPGFFFELYRAWGGVEGAGTEEGVTPERARLLDSLSRTGDAASAKLLFELLLAGETKEPALAMRTLMCAAKLLEAADLARLLPLLRAQLLEERPRNGAESPPSSALRADLLRGGFNALGYARVEAALDDVCDVVLDPALQPAAFDWRDRDESFAPYWALDALRDFPIAVVEPAFRRALARAEADRRLAACDPGDLLALAQRCRWVQRTRWWERGRALHEVALALCEALERLPGSEDVAFERMLALGGLSRYADAAAAARADAARKRARGYTLLDGYETPAYMEARARLYDALVARDARAIFLGAEASGDPFVWNLGAWYLRSEVVDVDLAARAGEEAVRGSGGLHRSYRDTLAAVRILQGQPAEALRLLDSHGQVPAKRSTGSLWHEAFFAAAQLARGEDGEARYALERAARDRRILPHLRADPTFARFAETFRTADENFFYDTLFARDPGE